MAILRFGLADLLFLPVSLPLRVAWAALDEAVALARREQHRESQGAIPEELADAQAALTLGELTRAEYERMAGPLAGGSVEEG